jgi:hypothetical protein
MVMKWVIGIFLAGVITSSTYVPMGVCYNLGYRGTTTKSTYCLFDDYYFVFNRPRGSRGPNSQVRVHKPTIITTWGIILIIAVGAGYAIGNLKKDK